MEYQKESNLKIGVSGAGKNYLKMPWSVEDTIENLEELKEMMQQKLIITNYHGRGEKDAEEIAFDFDRAIQALKENQEYKQLGTLEEVQELVELRKEKRPQKVLGVFSVTEYECQNCGNTIPYLEDYCEWCGQKLDWTEVEE